jgi:hypothetical protein
MGAGMGRILCTKYYSSKPIECTVFIYAVYFKKIKQSAKKKTNKQIN